MTQLAKKLGFAGAVVPLVAGSFHVVHKIERIGAPPLVMRSTIDKLFEVDRSLDLERRTAVWLNSDGYLVPATLGSGLRNDGAPFDFVLQAMANGTQLLDADLDNDPRLLAAVGASLRRIHAVPASGAGLLDLDEDYAIPTGVMPCWPDYICLRLDEHVRGCVEAGFVDAQLETRIRSLLEIMLPTLDNRPIRLLHGDPGTHNICVDPTTGMITAWLDWEDAMAGDPLFDVALLSTFQPPRRMPAVMKGYGFSPQSVDKERLIAFYFLRIAISKAVHRIRFGIKDRPDRHPVTIASTAGSTTSSDCSETDMRIFVTGATGFLGSSLIDELVGNGHELAILIRPGTDNWRIASHLSRLTVITGSFDDFAAWRVALAAFRPDAVAHLAWRGVGNADRNSPIQAHNIPDTVDLAGSA